MQKVRYAKIQVTGYVTFRYSTSSLNRDVEIYETYIIHIIQVITPFSIVTVCIVILTAMTYLSIFYMVIIIG